MSLKGVIFEKRKIGASTLNTEDGITGIIASLPVSAKPSKVEFGKTYPLYNLNNFLELGFSADYDKQHGIRLHRQVSEFYRLAEKGTKLYLYLVDSSKYSMDKIFDNEAERFLHQSGGDISLLMACVNGLSDVPTIQKELPQAVLKAIPKAQAFAQWCLQKHKPLHVLIEGYGLADSITNAQDLRKLGASCPQVSVVIAQDLKAGQKSPLDSLSKEVKDNYKAFADVGTYTGLLSKIQVNDNPGAVEKFSVKDLAQEIWTQVGLSNGKSVEELANDLDSLDAKGYVFAVSYHPYPGVYFNDGHVCSAEGVDLENNMNISNVMMSRTWNKAIRILWRALMPYIKKKFAIDAKTGKLPISTIKDLENYCEGHLNTMIGLQEISSSKVKIDPDSNLLTGNKELRIQQITLVPFGYTGVIRGSIGFKTQL